MRIFIIILGFQLWALCSGAQMDSLKRSIKDTTPIENLDYHLTRQEFQDYYGVDDTSRAIINMFYRYRGIAGVVYCLVPAASAGAAVLIVDVGVTNAIKSSPAGSRGCIPVGCINGTVAFLEWGAVGTVILVGGALVFPLVMTINRSIYTRKNLLKTLVNRERGIPPPNQVLKKLWKSDFDR